MTGTKGLLGKAEVSGGASAGGKGKGSAAGKAAVKAEAKADASVHALPFHRKEGAGPPRGAVPVTFAGYVEAIEGRDGQVRHVRRSDVERNGLRWVKDHPTKGTRWFYVKEDAAAYEGLQGFTVG